MTDLHAAVTGHPTWKRYAAELERAEAHHAKVTARLRAAEADHAEALAEYRRQLDAGTAPASGPPTWHPPADAGKLHADRLATRSRRREVLADLADDAEADLRSREGELLARAAELIAELEPLRAELGTVLVTMRHLSAARGIPAGDSTIPAGVTLAELVDAAAHRDRLLPSVLVDAAAPSPGRWTRDDPDAIPDLHPGRSALRGRARRR